MKEISDRSGRNREAAFYAREAAELKGVLNERCWDGKWYLRAFNNLSEPIGSSVCEDGKIFTNTQTWAVLSGLADNDRASECMAAARQFDEHLSEPYAYTSNTNAPASGRCGSSTDAWSTGTTCWCMRILTEGFLGIRAEWDGLSINPQLPSDWPTAPLSYQFRGTPVNIILDRQGRPGNEWKLTRNGTPVDGNLICIESNA